MHGIERKRPGVHMKYSVVVFAILIAAGPAWASKIVGNGKCAVMREKNGYYVQKQTEIDDAGNKRLGIKIIGNGYPSEKQALTRPRSDVRRGFFVSGVLISPHAGVPAQRVAADRDCTLAALGSLRVALGGAMKRVVICL